MTKTTRRWLKRWPTLRPALVAAAALAACTVIALAASTGASAAASAAAAQCSVPGLPEGKMPKPTAFAEFLSLEVWTVTTYRAEVSVTPGPVARTSEGVTYKIGADMYGRDGWVAQEFTYLPNGKSDKKLVYQRSAEEGPNDGAIYYSSSNAILARETHEVTVGGDGNAIVTKTLTDAAGAVLEVHTILHNDSGWEVLHTVTDAAGLVTKVITTVRREDGRPTLIETRDGQGSVISRTTRDYNDAGALLTETVWTPEEVIMSTFESDIDLNWIVRRNYRVVPTADPATVKYEPIDVIYRDIIAYG